MRDFSNTYIFVFSTVLIVVVAVLLSAAAMLLQPLQQRNVEIEKKQSILASINIKASRKDAEKMYDKYITSSFVVDAKGDKVEGVDAFGVDMAAEIRKPLDEREFPVYVSTLDDGSSKVIVPVRGKGLWGPVYGYISFNDDYNTIYGATFNHDKETPGLGAEIATRAFQKQFDGKKIFDDQGNFTSILIQKGGAAPGDPHAVDAISGGTLTSKGLQATLKDCLSGYIAYFKKQQEQK